MSNNKQVSVADYIMNRIAATGVRHVFLIPGGGSMYLVDALGRHPDLSYVAMLHEQGASIAAEAYGQFTGNLGVALVTTGPGGTNAMTGVAAAYLDSTPLLIVSGQVKTADSAIGRGVRQLGFQEIDVVSMAKPITKMAVRIESADEVPQVLELAIATAQQGRPGPVWVDVPMDIQASVIEVGEIDPVKIPSPSFDLATVKEVIKTLQESAKPVLLIGNGVRLAHVEDELLELIELIKVPTLLTWKALDLLPFDHRLNAGRPGGIATYYANYSHQFCDAYVAIGARLDMGQTGYRPDNIAPSAKRFIIDVDPFELEKLRVSKSELIEADAGDFIRQLVKEARKVEWVEKSPWIDQIQRWKMEYPLRNERSDKHRISTYEVLDVLSDFMGEDDVFVPGSSGACSEVSMQAFRNKRGQRVFNSEGLGPMGFGVPAPIGAWFVEPNKSYFSVDGDGGFHMNSQELEVARRFNMSICWVVLDNEGYGSIKTSQDNYFSGRRVASDLPSGLSLPSVEAIAAAHGIHTSSVSSTESLVRSLNSFRKNQTPTVLNVLVESDHRTSPRVTSTLDKSGRMTTSALEDLTPAAKEFR